MKIDKTDEEAEAFAKTLEDEGDAGVFRNLWARGEHGILAIHFPAFVADATPAKPKKSK